MTVTDYHVRDLLQPANDAATHISTRFVAFVVASLYLTITIGTTNDESLLRGSDLPLPGLHVGLPIVPFYVVAPLIYLVLHVNLLLKLNVLASLLQPAIEELRSPYVDQNEVAKSIRVRLHPFPFAQYYLDVFEQVALRRLVRSIFWCVVVIFPVVLFLWIQRQFLPYHSFAVIWWHRLLLWADLAIVWVYWRCAISRKCFRRNTQRQFACNIHYQLLQYAGLLLIIALSVIMTVPDECLWIDSMWKSNSLTRRWEILLHRNLYLPGRTLVVQEPPPEILAAACEKGDTDEMVIWLKYSRGLDLRGRNLNDANFNEARLYNAKLDYAQIRGAKLDRTRLPGASLRCAQVQGASFWEAQLPGADLSWAHLQMAKLSDANLSGANLRHALLQGTYLNRANLAGANLSNAHLQGAKLYGAELRGTDLSFSGLQGTNLDSAILGSTVSSASLPPALMEGIDIGGPTWKLARLYESSLRPLEMSWRLEPWDMSRIMWESKEDAMKSLEPVLGKAAATCIEKVVKATRFHDAQLYGVFVSQVALNSIVDPDTYLSPKSAFLHAMTDPRCIEFRRQWVYPDRAALPEECLPKSPEEGPNTGSRADSTAATTTDSP